MPSAKIRNLVLAALITMIGVIMPAHVAWHPHPAYANASPNAHAHAGDLSHTNHSLATPGDLPRTYRGICLICSLHHALALDLPAHAFDPSHIAAASAQPPHVCEPPTPGASTISPRGPPARA